MAFSFYSPVTVQTGQVPSTQTDFPVLVSYTDNRLRTTGNGGNVQNANGYDVRPYSDSGLTSALSYELERYNASTGEVIMWVKVPSLADGYVIYLAYGDAALSSNGSSNATWNSNFKGVWHLPDGTTLTALDSTSSGLNGTNNGVVVSAGKIAGGGRWDTNGDNISTANNAATSFTGASSKFTLQAWVNVEAGAPDSFSCFIAKWSATNSRQYEFGWVPASGAIGIQMSTSGSGGTLNVTTTGAFVSAGTWVLCHVTVDIGADVFLIYASGVARTTTGSAATGALFASTSTVLLGSAKEGTDDRFRGLLDECRIIGDVMTANWITTDFNNQSAPGTFAVLGTEVTVGGGGSPTVKLLAALGVG